MSRSQLTILTNICLIEDLETQRVVMQYRSPETNRWSGYAFPGGHVENGESFAESVIREIYEETGLTIQNPQLVGIIGVVMVSAYSYATDPTLISPEFETARFVGTVLILASVGISVYQLIVTRIFAPPQ